MALFEIFRSVSMGEIKNAIFSDDFFVFIASCATKEEKVERAKNRAEVNEYRLWLLETK